MTFNSLLKKTAAAGVVAAGLALPASAADPGYRWAGLYVGAHLGASWGDYKVTGDDGAFDEAGVETISLDPRSFIGGLQIGYNFVSGGLVFGVEADVSFANGTDSFVVVPSPDNFATVKLGTHGTLTGRLGLASGQFMPYLKGGLAWAHLRATAGDLIDGTTNPDLTDQTSLDKTLTGWTIGGGVEWALSSNWSAKAEYTYMDFRSVNTGNLDGDAFKHDLEVHSIKIGLNYKFGDRHAAPLK